MPHGSAIARGASVCVPGGRRPSAGPRPGCLCVARAPSVPGWHTGSQFPAGSRAVRHHSCLTGRQAPVGTRAVSSHWLTGRQSPISSRAVGSHWLTGRQSPIGSRAVSAPLARGPAVTWQLSVLFLWRVRVVATVAARGRSSGRAWPFKFGSGSDRDVATDLRWRPATRRPAPFGPCRSAADDAIVGRGRRTQAPRSAPDPSPCLRLKATAPAKTFNACRTASLKKLLSLSNTLICSWSK